jgi:hypothetical protein
MCCLLFELDRAADLSPQLGHCAPAVAHALVQHPSVECTGRAFFVLFHIAPHVTHIGDVIPPVVRSLGQHGMVHDGVRTWGGALVEKLAVLEVRGPQAQPALATSVWPTSPCRRLSDNL